MFIYRANVQLMRALADRTRIPPSGRIQKLRDFLTRLHENPKVSNIVFLNLSLACLYVGS